MNGDDGGTGLGIRKIKIVLKNMERNIIDQKGLIRKMGRKFRLKKDALHLKAGTEFKLKGYTYYPSTILGASYTLEEILSMPDWFEEVKDIAENENKT